jgi:hypothetical protein
MQSIDVDVDVIVDVDAIANANANVIADIITDGLPTSSDAAGGLTLPVPGKLSVARTARSRTEQQRQAQHKSCRP